MRLLLAEDERSLSRALVRILEHAGYAVDAVYDVSEALDYIMNGANYDGVILDIMMPKMDGLTVLARVRGEGNQIPDPDRPGTGGFQTACRKYHPRHLHLPALLTHGELPPGGQGIPDDADAHGGGKAADPDRDLHGEDLGIRHRGRSQCGLGLYFLSAQKAAGTECGRCHRCHKKYRLFP